MTLRDLVRTGNSAERQRRIVAAGGSLVDVTTGTLLFSPNLGWTEVPLRTLLAFRRRLHAHPEVSWAELETTAAVIDRLAVAGLRPAPLPDSTGLACDLGTGAPSPFVAAEDGQPIVALRADLDALAMEDDKDVAYRSTRPGIAHACGHDVHATVVLGAALALAQAVDLGEAGRFRFVFEPAEEALPGGALEVIDS